MRDIRGDLQDRANLLAEQISTAQGHFERYIEQLKREHETRLKDLKSALDTVHMLIGIEGRRLQSSLWAQSAKSLRAPQAQPQQPQGTEQLAATPVRAS